MLQPPPPAPLADAAADVFELLQRCEHLAREAVCAALCDADGLPGPPLAAVRLACRAARELVDGGVRALRVSIKRAGGRQDRQPLADAWACGLQRLEGVLGALPTRWPRVDALHVHMEAPSATGRQATAEAELREQGALLQQLLSAALGRCPAGCARLAQLHLRFAGSSGGWTGRSRLQLGPALFAALAAACPHLHALGLSGQGVALEGSKGQQELVFQHLARLPKLSSLALPGPHGLQHVRLLAGQLTRLEVAAAGSHAGSGVEGSEDEEGGQGGEGASQQRLLQARLAALRGLARLTHLTLLGTVDVRALLASLPPALKHLHLDGARLAFEGAGQLDAVVLHSHDLGCDSRPTLELERCLERRRAAACKLRPLCLLRLLRIETLHVPGRPVADEEALAAARRLAGAFERVEVQRVRVGLGYGAAAAFQQARELFGDSGSGGSEPGGGGGGSSGDSACACGGSGPGGAVPLTLCVEELFAEAGTRPVADVEAMLRCDDLSGRVPGSPPADALTTPDLLQPYLGAYGTARHLLLVCAGLVGHAVPDTDEDCHWGSSEEEDYESGDEYFCFAPAVRPMWGVPGGLEGWLQQHVAPHAPYARAVPLHPDLPGVALDFATPEAAAAAARGLLAARCTCRGWEVAVVPTPQMADRAWLAEAPVQALRHYLEHGRGGAEAKLRQATLAWKALGHWAGSFWPLELFPPPHEHERRVEVWRALAWQANGQLEGASDEEGEDEEDEYQEVLRGPMDVELGYAAAAAVQKAQRPSAARAASSGQGSIPLRLSVPDLFSHRRTEALQVQLRCSDPQPTEEGSGAGCSHGFGVAALLQPYLGAYGTARHLLLVCAGLVGHAVPDADEDCHWGSSEEEEDESDDEFFCSVPAVRPMWGAPGGLEGWLQQHVAPHAPYARAVPLHPDLPGVALEFATPEAAAAAARGLLAARCTCRGWEVAVVPTPQMADRAWLAEAPVQALRHYLEHGRGGAEAKLRQATLAWKALGHWAGSFSPLELFPPPHEHEGSVGVWRALAQQANGQLEGEAGPSCKRQRQQ